MQTTIDYHLERTQIERKLKKTETLVYNVLKENPHLRSIKRRNDLIRAMWAKHGDIPAESITRAARSLQAMDVFDTEDNQTHRANIEQAYRNNFAQ